MVETPESSWVEGLLGRLRRRPISPRLLDGYTQRVMERIVPPALVVRLRWDRTLRWALAPAAAVAVGVFLWVAVGERAMPLSHRALVQATVLERLDEPWSVEPVDEEVLVEDARQVDRFLLAQVPSTAAASAESLAALLNQLDEEPLDAAPDATPDDWLLDLANPENA